MEGANEVSEKIQMSKYKIMWNMLSCLLNRNAFFKSNVNCTSVHLARLRDKFISRLKWISFEDMRTSIYIRVVLFAILLTYFFVLDLRYVRQKFAVAYQKFKFAIATHTHTHTKLTY